MCVGWCCLFPVAVGFVRDIGELGVSDIAREMGNGGLGGSAYLKPS